MTSSPSTSAPVSAVHIDAVHKSFGDVHAVCDISMDIPVGQVLALLGPNGAGKSTLIDMVLGLTTPDCGTISFADPSGSKRRLSPADMIGQAGLSATLQSEGLVTTMTVASTLKLVASMHAVVCDVDKVIKATHLETLTKRKVGALSGGERQRLRLALALLPNPEVLILDEPTTGMDVQARAEFWETMHEQAHQGRTIIFATHYLQEAADFADKIAIINKGRLIAQGTTAELSTHINSTLLCARLPRDVDGGSIESRLIEAGVPFTEFEVSDQFTYQTILLRSTDSDAAARLLLTESPISNLSIQPASLDDVFSLLVTEDSQHND
ncbi:ABC transporter ATP-binding protein [Actinomyces vulturis]|uniref:ABC transporter ATP-binding protein n=1 Tax=Actinomyces vulturis TaxID=1857645 RepID=UPI00082F244B|nr:ABC transporter ATP-binding protein [Actinomyces vulturis]